MQSNRLIHGLLFTVKFVITPMLMNASGLSIAQTVDPRLPVSLDADSTAYDGKSSMVMFRGLRLTQGRLGIAANEGFASQMDFEDSTWHFEGNVVIDIENGHIESDVADVKFTSARVESAAFAGIGEVPKVLGKAN